MGTAYRCKEEFTPDGKRLVRRERVIGDNVIWGGGCLDCHSERCIYVPTGELLGILQAVGEGGVRGVDVLASIWEGAGGGDGNQNPLLRRLVGSIKAMLCSGRYDAPPAKL